jgi:hypothetical protein
MSSPNRCGNTGSFLARLPRRRIEDEIVTAVVEGVEIERELIIGRQKYLIEFFRDGDHRELSVSLDGSEDVVIEFSMLDIEVDGKVYRTLDPIMKTRGENIPQHDLYAGRIFKAVLGVYNPDVIFTTYPDTEGMNDSYKQFTVGLKRNLWDSDYSDLQECAYSTVGSWIKESGYTCYNRKISPQLAAVGV